MRLSVLSLCAVLLVIGVNQVTAQTATNCDQYNGWQAYWSSWFTQYPAYAYYNMYPFGEWYCDTNATQSDKTVGVNPQIAFTIPFYGSTYRSAWITPFGYVLLNESSNLMSPASSYIQIQWPNPNYPTTGSVDPPFIAPFYAFISYRYGMAYEPSQISYRVLDPASTPTTTIKNIMTGMLTQISTDVRAAVPGAHLFQATAGLVVTYYNVTYYGQACVTGDELYDTCRRNTFQVAIVTDGVNTHTVFNYFNITWVGSADQQYCDPLTGLASSSFPNCSAAQIGFNSGFARGFTRLPYSATGQVVDMDTLSGTNVTGRWIYQVSGDTITRGGCTNQTSLGEDGSWPLVAVPSYGPMFGGSLINVSGPCFLPGQTIKCKFGSAAPVTGYYWGNMMQAMCVQPPLYTVGPIELSVSTDGGNNYYFKTSYHVYQQERVPNLGVTVVNTNNDWLKPSTFQLTWNHLTLSTEWGNRVTIQLLGYRERTWQVVYTFAFQFENTGEYTATFTDKMCYDQNHEDICAKYNVGAFRVSLSNWQWDLTNPTARWSPAVPMGWFMKNKVSDIEGGGWSDERCNDWYNADTAASSIWLTTLSPCPCTLNQSYVDFGRFQPTTDCNLQNLNQPGRCPNNLGAVACFESTSISIYGANSRCCYDSYGNLMYSGDARDGSISQRSNPSGLYPFDQHIPSISHMENDILPYHYCCTWEDSPYDCFNLYMSIRPTQDCKSYTLPGHATAYGDPHFHTMDDVLYSFNAWGEFWLLQVTGVPMGGRPSVSFSLQGRFEQPANKSWGQVYGTVMTAVAMQLNSGTIVSVISNLYNLDEHLLIFVNSTLLNFTDPDTSWQQFPDFTIICNDPQDVRSYTNFTIIFNVGIGINVAWATGVMELIATLPPEFMRTTGGLFGFWNDDPDDDLMPRGNQNQPVDATDAQSVFYAFGMSWVVKSSESIFTYLYRSQLNYKYYFNDWFVPYFTAQFPPNSTLTEAQVNAVCESDSVCAFDYKVSQNQSVAADTHAITQWNTELRTLGSFVATCGWLDIPNSVKQQPISYLGGSQVTVLSCMDGYEWQGSTYVYTCQLAPGGQSATWSPPTPDLSCVWLNGQLPQWEQIAIGVPVAVVGTAIIVTIIVLIVLYVRRRRKEKKQTKGNHPAPNTAASSTFSSLQSAAPPSSAANVMTVSSFSAFQPVQSSGAKEDSVVRAYQTPTALGGGGDDYLDKASRHSGTTSRMSYNSTAYNNQLRQASSQMSLPHPASRPLSPSSTGMRVNNAPRTTVTYTTDPAHQGASVTRPYVYPTSSSPAAAAAANDVNRGTDYFIRRYGMPNYRRNSKDSEV